MAVAFEVNSLQSVFSGSLDNAMSTSGAVLNLIVYISCQNQSPVLQSSCGQWSNTFFGLKIVVNGYGL